MTLSDTPNVGPIKNPDIRFIVTAVLFGLSLLAAIAALFFSFFPEAVDPEGIATRAIAFTNAVISFVAAAFGLGVSLPNVPRTHVES